VIGTFLITKVVIPFALTKDDGRELNLGKFESCKLMPPTLIPSGSGSKVNDVKVSIVHPTIFILENKLLDKAVMGVLVIVKEVKYERLGKVAGNAVNEGKLMYKDVIFKFPNESGSDVTELAWILNDDSLMLPNESGRVTS
jgi:hypothetical protein